MNHEAILPIFLHPNGQTIAGTGNAAVRTSAAEVLGVSRQSLYVKLRRYQLRDGPGSAESSPDQM